MATPPLCEFVSIFTFEPNSYILFSQDRHTCPAVYDVQELCIWEDCVSQCCKNKLKQVWPSLINSEATPSPLEPVSLHVAKVLVCAKITMQVLAQTTFLNSVNYFQFFCVCAAVSGTCLITSFPSFLSKILLHNNDFIGQAVRTVCACAYMWVCVQMWGV